MYLNIFIQNINRSFHIRSVEFPASDLFPYGRWADIRQQLYLNTEEVSPDDIVGEMLWIVARWNRFVRYFQAFLVAKNIELDRWRDRIAGASLN